MTLLDTPWVDQDVRDAIRSRLDVNMFVEAGAGTGKTKVVVDRIVHAVAIGVIREASGLVAITFTEAAAAELRDRIRSELEKAAGDSARDPIERERCATARAALDQAIITTLHGFALRILAEHPLRAGLPPRFEVQAEVDAQVRFAERWNAFCDDLFADDTAANDLLIGNALGMRIDRLRDVARLLHDRWDRVVDASYATDVVLPAIDLRSIAAGINEGIALVGPWLDDPECQNDGLVKSARAYRDVLPDLEEAIAAGDDLDGLRLLKATKLPKIGGNKKVWGDKKATIAAPLDRARDLRDTAFAGLRTAVTERLLPRLAEFTMRGVAERTREGRLEFHDLLVLARDLLHRDTAVRTAMAARIDLMVIDEFQDTDPLQVDIAFALAAADPTAPVPPWQEAELAEGKLVVVGDPKQSIYGFRGADISIWSRAKPRFGTVARLEQNFRTVEPVIEWVNEVFEAVIAGGAEGLQPKYEALAASRPALGPEAAVVLVGGPSDDRTAAVRERESEDLATLVAKMKDDGWDVSDVTADGGCRGVRFDDIAILVPTRTPLSQIERALDRLDIPYRVESRSLVWATDAVRDLLNILTAVDDPSDRIAVVAALRSPAFACSDPQLVEWKLRGGRWDHRAEVPDELAAHPVAAALAALRRYHDERWEVPVDELVESIVRECRMVQLTFAFRRPRDHWRRLRFVIDQARAFIESGGASLGEFLAWAELQAGEGATSIETPVPEPDDDAVRILTIHGSKGLEFPVVVLAGLGGQRSDIGPWVRWGDTRPEVCFGPQDARFESHGYAGLAEASGDADRYEGQRLLYVAATRARDHLVVSVHYSTGVRNSYAQVLRAACAETPAWPWHAPETTEQLTLVDVDASADALPGDDELTVADWERWRADYDALVAATHSRRFFSATALAALDHDDGDDGDDDRNDDDRNDEDRNDDNDDGAPFADDGATDRDDGEPSVAPPSFRRGGTAVGRAVHAVLQTVDLDGEADLTSLAAYCAAAESLSDAEQIEALAASALTSPVVREARAAGIARRWREVPVAAPLGDGRVIEGYIDLLFEDRDGALVLVDYKTDAASDDAVARYRVQAGAYAYAVERATGRTVDRAVFVFCHAGGAVEREVDDLAGAVADAVALARG